MSQKRTTQIKPNSHRTTTAVDKVTSGGSVKVSSAREKDNEVLTSKTTTGSSSAVANFSKRQMKKNEVAVISSPKPGVAGRKATILSSTVPRQAKSLLKEKTVSELVANVNIGKLANNNIKVQIPRDIKPSGNLKKSVVQSVTSSSNKNVMNTVHNVTVASPNLKRKEVVIETPIVESVQQQKPRNRTRTRTIDPEESVMQRILQQQRVQPAPAIIPKPEPTPSAAPPPPPPERTPSPIAFEISMEKTLTVKARVSDNPNEEADYEDDFESYESDFESEEPSKEENPSPERSDEEQEVIEATTQETAVHIEERKLDSGNYDLPVSKDRQMLEEIQETTEIVTAHPQDYNVKKPRAAEKRRIVLNYDLANFNIFEQKPMEYDRFMRVFGHLNSSQAVTQTKRDDMCHEEVQTEDIEKDSRWTQYPTEFSSHRSNMRLYQEDTLGVGVERDGEYKNMPQFSNIQIDYDRLNMFLKSSSVVISNIIENQSPKEAKDSSKVDHCVEAKRISLGDKEKRVKGVFGFNCLLVLVVENKDQGVEHNTIEIYSTSALESPQSILSSWNQISSVLIHSKYPSHLLSASLDGSINLYNWLGSLSAQEEDESVLRKRPPIATFRPIFLKELKEYCTLVKLVELTTGTNYSISGEDLAAMYSQGVIIIWSIDIISDSGSVTLREMKMIELSQPSKVPRGVKSTFEKNITYFENRIFSDAALKELESVKTVVDQAQHLFYIDLLFDGESLVSISNQNVVIVTSMGLSNQSKKVVVSEASEDNGIVKITAAAVFSPGLLLIALSDGTLKIKRIVRNLEESGSDFSDDDNDNERGNIEIDQDVELLLAGKSCAIQNIVLNERKLYSDLQTKGNLDSLARKEGFNLVSEEFSRKKVVSPERVLVHGDYFRRSKIRDLQVTEKAIYFVDRKELKVFDLKMEQLMTMNLNSINGISVTQDNSGRISTLIVNSVDCVELHEMEC